MNLERLCIYLAVYFAVQCNATFLHLRFLWRKGDRGLRDDSYCCF